MFPLPLGGLAGRPGGKKTDRFPKNQSLIEDETRASFLRP